MSPKKVTNLPPFEKPVKNAPSSSAGAGTSFQPSPSGTARCGAKKRRFWSSGSDSGNSLAYVMFGVVPAATSSVRAGSSTTSPEPPRRNRTAWSFPNSSGTASSGSSVSMKEMPSSSALITSSWFNR